MPNYHKENWKIQSVTEIAMVKLYDRKNALVAADVLNDKAIPFFEDHGIPLLRILTDRGSEYCGNREHHEYTSSTSPSKTLTIAEQRQNHRRAMVSARGSRRRCSTSSTR